MNVEVVCTTDDPIDSLEHSRAIAADPTIPAAVYPAWRPDKAMAVDNPVTYVGYLLKLSAAADMEIRSYDALLEALNREHASFRQMAAPVGPWSG